jgi:hypothetical protein
LRILRLWLRIASSSRCHRDGAGGAWRRQKDSGWQSVLRMDRWVKLKIYNCSWKSGWRVKFDYSVGLHLTIERKSQLNRNMKSDI